MASLLAAAQLQAESLVDGSAEAGKAKSLTCTACHGAEGNSVNPLWPNTAGQHAKYVTTQLQAFKSGGRMDPLMTSQAMLLSDQDMADLAVYFESLPGAVQAVADPKLVPRGEALYRGGNQEKGVAACLGCHGPAGRGNAAADYPAIQGQHAAYTAKQLERLCVRGSQDRRQDTDHAIDSCSSQQGRYRSACILRAGPSLRPHRQLNTELFYEAFVY